MVPLSQALGPMGALSKIGGGRMSGSSFQLRLQIFQSDKRVLDRRVEVSIGQEASFDAPNFQAKLTVHGISNGLIHYTAALESGYRYVTPDLEIENGKTSVLEFYGTSSHITATQI